MIFLCHNKEKSKKTDTNGRKNIRNERAYKVQVIGIVLTVIEVLVGVFQLLIGIRYSGIISVLLFAVYCASAYITYTMFSAHAETLEHASSHTSDMASLRKEVNKISSILEEMIKTNKIDEKMKMTSKLTAEDVLDEEKVHSIEEWKNAFMKLIECEKQYTTVRDFVNEIKKIPGFWTDTINADYIKQIQQIMDMEKMYGFGKNDLLNVMKKYVEEN